MRWKVPQIDEKSFENPLITRATLVEQILSFGSSAEGAIGRGDEREAFLEMEFVEPGRLEVDIDAAVGRGTQVAEDEIPNNVPDFVGQSEPHHI